jgi:hypothetical protein
MVLAYCSIVDARAVARRHDKIFGSRPRMSKVRSNEMRIGLCHKASIALASGIHRPMIGFHEVGVIGTRFEQKHAYSGVFGQTPRHH